MAQQVTITIGGVNGVRVASAPYAFPTQGIRLETAAANTVFDGITMLTKVVVLTSGLKVAPNEYFSPTALSAIVTLAG